MTPASFPEQTVVFAKDQAEYLPLPAHVTTDGYVVSTFCWQLTWRERIRLLVTGKIWHQVMTFGHSLQPQNILTEKPELKP